jgi:hypothetical protein
MVIMKNVRVELTVRVVEECDGACTGEHEGFEVAVGAGFLGVSDEDQAGAIGLAIAQAGGRVIARIGEKVPEIRRQAEDITSPVLGLAALGPDAERTDDAPTAEELEAVFGDVLKALAELVERDTDSGDDTSE